VADQQNAETDDLEPTEQRAAEQDAPASADDDAAVTGVADADALQAELKDARARALRAQADLDNYRKRVQRENEQERRYASMPLLRGLLPAVDNIQRAIEAAETSQESSGLLEGVKLVAQQMETVMAQHHCKTIQALGEPFDPNLHEAISQMPSDEFPAGTVMTQTAIGYQLHDRVVRPSQVIVSTGPAASEEGSD